MRGSNWDLDRWKLQGLAVGIVNNATSSTCIVHYFPDLSPSTLQASFKHSGTTTHIRGSGALEKSSQINVKPTNIKQEMVEKQPDDKAGCITGSTKNSIAHEPRHYIRPAVLQNLHIYLREKLAEEYNKNASSAIKFRHKLN